MVDKITTIRLTDDMQDMLEYLHIRTLLNTSGIIRLALSNLYNEEMSKELK